MPVESIQNASDLLLSPPKGPAFWGWDIHCVPLIGNFGSGDEGDNTGRDGIVGGYRGCEGSSSHYAANDCEKRAGKEI